MNSKINIVADENIPRLAELLGNIADITYLPGRNINADDLVNADALLVRSITRVDQALLAKTNLKFIGSCTIGTDHVDIDYLQTRNITFANAPGCNAQAVVDYVLTAIFSFYHNIADLRQKTVGIVGLGQVGSRLHKRLLRMGVKSRLYDPFVAEATSSFAEVLSCDIVSLHVPLTRHGRHKTYHLISENELTALNRNALLINSSRGPVIDNKALLEYLKDHELKIVLDVYEDEPSPNLDLLNAINIATSHIAGYSIHGKIRGSMQIVMALLDFFSIEATIPDLLSGLRQTIELRQDDDVALLIKAAYDIAADSQLFVGQYSKCVTVVEQGRAFDAYRKAYPGRYEWQYVDVVASEDVKDIADMLGFMQN